MISETRTSLALNRGRLGIAAILRFDLAKHVAALEGTVWPLCVSHLTRRPQPLG